MVTTDISGVDIYLVCNEDIQLAALIVSSLRDKGSDNIHLLISDQQSQCIGEKISANIVSGTWNEIEDYEVAIADAVIVISMMYHDFEKQEKLFSACVRQDVALFIAWDSGMELHHLVPNQACPRTQLHQTLLDYESSLKPFPHKSHESPITQYSTSHIKSYDKMHWVLFQVGIFADEILKNDVSTVTTAFHSPKQFIFINVSVKSDFAQIIANVIVSNKIKLNKNYVVGEFVSHTFLGHIYNVFNQGHGYNSRVPCELSEFEMSNLLRLSGIVSSRLLPRIIYPNCNVYVWKLCMEVSLQHEAIIYKLLANDHRQITLRDWVRQIIDKEDEANSNRLQYKIQ
ncbi:6022_t:CDS:2 [Acaulospora morrowiae]|uniref:6022_t:CDS:1 n=1 Tax=Acaulospora morrowiae TaxID=94023 RepID=A0A9N9FLM1_9GLOM|nr:6022_t:CDS:2 [Acaulospora morrowiae]